jgi:hypothetical protein
MMLKMTQASKQNTRDESQIHLSDPIPNTVTYAPTDNSCNKQKQLKSPFEPISLSNYHQ